jgi:hypothetical protein
MPAGLPYRGSFMQPKKRLTLTQTLMAWKLKTVIMPLLVAHTTATSNARSCFQNGYQKSNLQENHNLLQRAQTPSTNKTANKKEEHPKFCNRGLLLFLKYTVLAPQVTTPSPFSFLRVTFEKNIE